MTDTENKTPKFLPSTRLGESGLRDNKLYVPFFLWGSNLENVLPNFEFNSFISKPRKMNFAFFTRLAKHINTKFRATGGLRMDWDWDSVKKNIIMPNIEHIKEVNNLNDKHIEMIKDDLYVALNNWTDNWDKDDIASIDEMEAKGLYFPNGKNFFNNDLEELEY